MELPNLNRIVEAHIHVTTGNVDQYLLRLRTDVLPTVRKLQQAGHVRWYSFLLHPAKQVLGHAADDEAWVIHLRFEPSEAVEVNKFIDSLPKQFEKPKLRLISNIEGLDGSILLDQDWSHAWRIVGASSEWVMCLLEAHPADLPVDQIAHFLHYISNPLGLGWQWAFAPAGIRF